MYPARPSDILGGGRAHGAPHREHRIGDILVDMNACTQQELQAALQTQAIFGGRLGTNLLELGIVDERQLASALSRVHGIPCVGDDVEPEPDAIAALSAELVERFGVIPLHTDDRLLRVAIVDPRNLASLDDLAFATGRRIEPVVAPEARLWTLMRRFYGIEKNLRGLAMDDDLEAAPGREAALASASAAGTRIISHGEALRLMDRMNDPVVLSALLVRGAASSVGRAVLLEVRTATAPSRGSARAGSSIATSAARRSRSITARSSPPRSTCARPSSRRSSRLRGPRSSTRRSTARSR